MKGIKPFGNKKRGLKSHPGASAMGKMGLGLCFAMVSLLFCGCGEPGNPIDDLFTSNIYPGSASTYIIGSPESPYSEGHFDSLTTDELNVETWVLTGNIWEDLQVPVTLVRVPDAKAPVWTNFNCSQVLAFEDQALADNEEEVYFVMELPHTYKEGTGLEAHVHFVYSDNSVGEKVKWGLEYAWTNLDDAFPGSSTIYALTEPSNNDAGYHRVASFPTIDGSGKKICSILVGRLFRNSSHADDTYTENIYLLAIDAHYRIDSFGSSQEFVK